MRRSLNSEENPITSIQEALGHLKVSDHRTDTLLIFPLDKTLLPYIERNFFGREGHHTGTWEWLITKELADSLVNNGFVAGTPQWGFTDWRNCRITDRGIEEFFKLKEEEPKNENS